LEKKRAELRSILLWEIAAGLLIGLVGGTAAGLLAVEANHYLSQGLANTAFYTFGHILNAWLVTAVVAAAIVAAATAVCLLSSYRAKTAALFLAVPCGVLVAYLVGYDINRYDFKAFWLAPRSLLGIPLRAVFFERIPVLANIGVLAVSIISGWALYKALLVAFRRLGSSTRRPRVRVRPEWVLVALVAFVAGFEVWTAVHRSQHKAAGPNIVLISLDTLRRDHLGCYGYAREVSPGIDRLAETSVVYENAVTQAGSTLSSHKSVMTSMYSPLLRVPGDQRLDRRHITLAEMLLDEGYRTAAFANGLGWVTPLFRFDQGFDTYVVPSRRIVPTLATAEEITHLGLSWVRKHAGDRFLLFLHYGDIHSDFNSRAYDAPEPYGSMFLPPGSERFDRSAEQIRGSAYLTAINWGRYDPPPEEIDYLKALYDGGIRYTDEHIARLVDGLRDLGVLDQTMIVIFSDHGEEFLEHGRVLHGWVYCEVARVPLIIRYPGAAAGGTRVAGLVELLDVAPTILAQAGLKPGPEMAGRDLAAAGAGEPAAYTEGEDAYALRTERWMYLLDIEDGHREMYCVADDPLERENVLGRHPEDEEALEAALIGWVEVVEAGTLRGAEGEPAKLNRKTRELLKSLGYLHSGE
jgi:arylsulfatase A-like enzyme